MSTSNLSAAFNALKEDGVGPLKNFGTWIESCKRAFQAYYPEDNDADYVASSVKSVWPTVVKNDLGILLETLQDREKKPAFNREQIFIALSHVYGAPDNKLEVFAKLVGDTPTAGPRWQNTDIYLKANNKVTINYVSGQWTANPSTGMVDAAGNGNFKAKEGYTLPGENEGALVGRLVSNSGPTPSFLVGKSLDYTALTNGYLELGINDDLMGEFGDGFADNEGSIVVEIVTNRATS